MRSATELPRGILRSSKKARSPVRLSSGGHWPHRSPTSTQSFEYPLVSRSIIYAYCVCCSLLLYRRGLEFLFFCPERFWHLHLSFCSPYIRTIQRSWSVWLVSSAWLLPGVLRCPCDIRHLYIFLVGFRFDNRFSFLCILVRYLFNARYFLACSGFLSVSESVIWWRSRWAT